MNATERKQLKSKANRESHRKARARWKPSDADTRAARRLENKAHWAVRTNG